MGLILHQMSPGELWRLFGVLALVVALLYLLKERRRTVLVPYLRVLRDAVGKSLADRSAAKWKRLRSFLVQAMVLFLAVLGLSDPEWDGRIAMEASDAEERATTQLVILLDRSRSMGMTREELPSCDYPEKPATGDDRLDAGLCAYGVQSDALPTTLDVAKGRAAYLIHQSDPDTRVLLATLDRRVSVLGVWEGRSRALEILASILPTDFEDRPQVAIPWLQNLRSNHPRARSYVVTDLQREETWSVAEATGWDVEGVGRRGRNLILERFRVRADTSSPGSARARCTLRYDAHVEGATEVGVAIEVSAGALAAVSQRVVVAVERRRLTPGQSVDVDLAFKGLPGALLRARLIPDNPEDDLVEADSKAWAEVPSLTPARVAIVGSPPPFLVAALLADPFVDLLPPANTWKEVPENAEISIFVGQLPPSLRRPAMLFAPPVGSHPLAGVVLLEPGQAKATSNPFWKRFLPGEIPFEQAVALAPSSKERILLSAGKAVVATSGSHEGFPLLRFGLDPFAEGLGTSPFFPALVARSIDFLQSRLDLVGREHEVGPILLDVPVGKGLLKLFSRDGAEVHLGGAGRQRTAWVEKADLYMAHASDGTVSPVVVTFASGHGEGVATGATRLAVRAPDSHRKPIARSGLWVGLILLIALAMIVEHALFVWRRVW